MNAIVKENGYPGTADWQLTRFQLDDPPKLRADPLVRQLRSSILEGYASKTSVEPGDTIDFMVSLNPAGRFRLDIFRMGYYAGAGARHVAAVEWLEGVPQPLPMMTIERLRECRWPPSITFRIPDEWISGVYLAKLTRDGALGCQSYVIFVVKQHRRADILFQVSDLTWQAYNKWPASDSLYDDGSGNLWYVGPNVRVGFDRPYAKYCQCVDAPLSSGSGEFLLWEYPLAFWLEAAGYDVAYCSNLDTHSDPGLLQSSKVFTSVGHDEYWTGQMYANVTAARDSGTSILFLSGNSVFWEVAPYPSSITGDPFRAFARLRRIENDRALMGATTYGVGYGDWVVTSPDHWIYADTGLQSGDRIPGLVGWEGHGAPLADLSPLEVVARSPVAGSSNVEAYTGWPAVPKFSNEHAAVIYPGPRGNWVFNAGTIWWSQGLSAPPGHVPAAGPRGRPLGPDTRVQRITHNVLRRCLGLA